MKKVYPKETLLNPLMVLRKAGYAPTKDPVTGEESYMVRLSKELYPRFHLYVEQTTNGVSFNLHLDQKKASYGEGHAHSGEYEGSTVEKEMDRIDGWVKAVQREAVKPVTEKQKAPAKRKGFFAKLFS